RKAQVADAAMFGDRRLGGQPLPIDEALTGIGVDGEVADLKRGEVLKEMTALRRNYAEIPESRLNNYPRSGDLVPGHRNSQPRVGRSPAAHSDQQVRRILLAKLSIEMGDALRHFGAAGAFKAVEVNHDRVAQVLQTAMSQHLRALAYQALRFHTFQANLFAAAGQHQRAQLKKAELGSFAGLPGEPNRKLDFHRTSHGVLTDAHKLIKDGGQGKHAVLEDGRETHNARAGAAQPVIDCVIVLRVGGA